MYPVSDDIGRWGYIASSGEWLIRPQFRSAFGFDQGVAYVKTADGEADLIIDTMGRELARFQEFHRLGSHIGYALDFDGRHIAVGIHLRGAVPRLVAQDITALSSSDRCNWAAFGDDGFRLHPKSEFAVRWDGAIQISRVPRDAIMPLDAHRVVVLRSANHFEVLDLRTDECVLPSLWDFGGSFSEGLVCVGVEAGSYEYLDESLKRCFGRTFSAGHSFRGGLTTVRDDKTWRVMLRDGRFGVTLRYEDATRFTGQGLLVAQSANNEFFILNSAAQILGGPFWAIDVDEGDFPYFKVALDRYNALEVYSILEAPSCRVVRHFG